MKEKVIVGMSGGVDSSVAAYLLKEQGFDVIGVTLELLEGTGADPQIEDAKKVAERLEIPHYTINFKTEFNKYVLAYFVAEYENCRTPNPCIMCNRYIKWEALLDRADDFGAKYIATGHYARIETLSNGRLTVCNSLTAKKDQTYALYSLAQQQLARTLMPIGEYEKAEIRRIAESARLPVADKHDSQDICFVPDHDYAAFIERCTGTPGTPGRFVSEAGEVIGEHRGLIHYTIGQRKGLGISAETRLFVKALVPETNEVVLCDGQSLFADTCLVEQVNCMGVDSLEEPRRAVGKIRYSHAGAPCTIYPEAGGMLRCVFDEPQRAITPGQAAVFYEDDHVLCGGIIRE